MADYQLSRKAERDLVTIARYTIESFGIKQARQYRNSIERCFRNLKENPDLGRNAEEHAPMLRCFEHRSHVIYYIPRETGPFIVRILHKRMQIENHF